jgi:hypothetical protein
MAGDLIIDLARAGGERAWRGCTLAANHASYYHDAHDFASITLCGLPLTGLREDRVTSAMRECPACARVAAEHAGHGADDCPLPRPLPRTAFYDRMRTGHITRTGHQLNAVLVTDGGGIWRVQRSCCHDRQEG